MPLDVSPAIAAAEADRCWRFVACCSAVIATGNIKGWYQPAAAKRRLCDGPVVDPACPKPPRLLDDAWHEAGHAVIGLAVGWPVIAATVDGSACVWFDIPHVDLDPIASLVKILAGPAAQAERERFPFRLSDESFDFYFRMQAAADNSGACDHCRLLRMVVDLAGARGVDPRALFRQVEAYTAALVARRDIRISILRVAEALMHRGRLDGAEVAALILPTAFDLDHQPEEPETIWLDDPE